jgi:putative transposase
MLQSLGRYYVRYINTAYQRTGSLWEGRYKSSLVDNERYLLTLYRYIELNPVRAAMVEHAGDYPWSGFQSNGLGKSIELITPHEGYLSLGTEDAVRRKAYCELFKGRMTDQVLSEIRDATNKGWVLGSDQFKRQVEQVVSRRVGVLGHGGDRRSKRFNS